MNMIDQISKDLLAAGIRPGGVLMVHSSLKSLGHVPGGSETVIQGLLAALGDEGTLFMPALCWELVHSQQPVFDVRHTASHVGAIPEYFRQRSGTRRSIHPTHSVCGVGPLAEEWLPQHIMDNTPCGPHSPFHRLPLVNGQILMLGCGLKPNTSMHAIEEMIKPPYLFRHPLTYQLIDKNGQMREKSYRRHRFAGYTQRYDRAGNILKAPDLTHGRVLAAESLTIEATALWSAALSALESDLFYFVDKLKTESIQ